MAMRLQKLGTLLSQTANALLLGGNPDQSVSSRAWTDQIHSERWARARVWIDTIFGKNHCKNSFARDIAFVEEVMQKEVDLVAVVAFERFEKSVLSETPIYKEIVQWEKDHPFDPVPHDLVKEMHRTLDEINNKD